MWHYVDQESDGPSVIIMAPNNEAASRPASFTCFNINCYSSFKTERGLRQHLWRNDACRDYMTVSEAIVGLCFVLPSPGVDDSNVLVVTEKEKWASMFYESANVDYNE